ncbi:filaggrin-like, partial [Nannospalax galili]|uniref:filaggrin-like n=1 Tax=Nannospalax galili TaxID=1026970 RepID=UPI0004ED3DC6
MSTLLENITSMIKIFHEYSNKDEETETLSKNELKELLEVEFQSVLRNPNDPNTADIFMEILDVDHNDKIDFTEFLLMVFKLAQAYYESRSLGGKQRGTKHRRSRHQEHEEGTGEEEEKREHRSHHSRNDSTEKRK